MNPPTTPVPVAPIRHAVEILDEVEDALDRIGAVADLLRLVRSDEDAGMLRLETIGRAGTLIDGEVEHIRTLLRERGRLDQKVLS